MAGHRHICQVTIERERGQYLDPVNRCPLALVDRGRVSMIDVVVEALLYRDRLPVLALPNLGNNTARSGVHDLCQHSVLHAERAFVLEEDDLIADGKPADPVFRFEGVTGLDEATLHQLGARHRVQHPHITAKMGEDKRGPGRIVFPIPIGDEIFDCLRLQGRTHHPAIGAIGCDGFTDMAAGKIE